MKIDVSLYTYSLPSLLAIAKSNEHLPIQDVIALASAATHIPVLACAYLLGDKLGYSPEIQKVIDSATKFYKYDEIKGLEVCQNLKPQK